MQYELINLFAVPVYKAPLERAFSNQELEFFDKHINNAVSAISNQASADKQILDAPEMAELRQLISAHLNSYFQRIYDTANQVKLEITQSWLAVSNQGDAHHTHSHPNSIASGVVYINLAARDGINFYRDEDRQWFDLQPRENNYYNAYSYHVETKVGDIVIFPSQIKHGVRPVQENVRRLSLAFNSFFSGEIGHPEFSNRLKIRIEP
jgi:uncharacterized protein (TIGR02466 family)